jgi:hypothetical protein
MGSNVRLISVLTCPARGHSATGVCLVAGSYPNRSKIVAITGNDPITITLARYLVRPTFARVYSRFALRVCSLCHCAPAPVRRSSQSRVRL